eukprot:scaffold42387_cov32-Phaeocystis_antarctica.AAC.2
MPCAKDWMGMPRPASSSQPSRHTAVQLGAAGSERSSAFGSTRRPAQTQEKAASASRRAAMAAEAPVGDARPSGEATRPARSG